MYHRLEDITREWGVLRKKGMDEYETQKEW